MSAQALVRVGESEDLYYADHENCKKQSIPVEYNTRFTQELSNKAQGTSVFTIPPGNGVRHILLVIGYSPAALTNNGAFVQQGLYVAPRGWGYQAVRQVSFRIGGSSQYFLSGQQLLQRNLRLVRTKEQRNSILSLGGAQMSVASDFTTNQFAYIPISVFCPPSADGIALPVAGDLLSQQIQITVELAAPSDWWVLNPNPAALTGGVPSSFSAGYFQVEQLVMPDRSMSLANRADMDTHSYGLPIHFDQQETTIPVAAGGSEQSLTLTGFRAGEVKKISVWLTKNSDTENKQKWYAPAKVQVLYAGVIYSSYDNGSSRMWNLLDGTAPSAVDTLTLSAAGGGGGAMVSTGSLNEWAELPFSQPTGDDYEATVLVHGKEITNGIVNLQLTPPTADAYTAHIVYSYNCTASFSRGSCDLIF